MSMILVVVASGSSGPWIPGVRTLLGGGPRGVAARVKGGYYGGGEVAARVWGESVAPGFKNKTRYTPYVSPGSQISHIATNNGNIIRQCLSYSILV